MYQYASDLRFVSIVDPNTAVGTAARLMMSQPAFANLGFGEWTRVLDGQVTRGHCGFVVDAYGQVVGFAGWALATEAKAEAWATYGVALTDADCRDGDCIIINAWFAKDQAINRFLLRTLRVIGASKKTAYFRRNYRGGVSRVARLPVNKFVAGHIARDASRAPSIDLPVSEAPRVREVVEERT